MKRVVFSQERINYLAILGLVISLCASVWLIMDYWKWGASLVDRLGGFIRLESAWEQLTIFDPQDLSLSRRATLTPQDKGFKKALMLIQSNRPALRSYVIEAIINQPRMSYSSDGGVLFYNIIRVTTIDGEEGIPVVTEELFREWINIARMKWTLRTGFLILVFGFAMSLASQFFRLARVHC